MGFTMGIARSVIAFCYHFYPRSTKILDLETFPQFATAGHRKSKKMCPKYAQGGLPNPIKNR
jgi:hypothetical protein